MVYEDWFNSLIAKEIPLVSSFRLENELTNDVTISKYVQNSSSIHIDFSACPHLDFSLIISVVSLAKITNNIFLML